MQEHEDDSPCPTAKMVFSPSYSLGVKVAAMKPKSRNSLLLTRT